MTQRILPLIFFLVLTGCGDDRTASEGEAAPA